MECLKWNEIGYEKEIIKMAKHDKDKNDKKRKSQGKEDYSDVYVIPKSTINILKGVVGTCITVLLTVAGWIVIQLYNLNATSVQNTEAISDIKDNIKEINTGLNGSANTDGVYTRLKLIEDKLDIPTIIASTDTSAAISKLSIEYRDTNITATSLSPDTCIGTDADGKVYLAENLINETILLTYMEADKEVYFLGQYNENYNWNGYCITNAYNSNGTLYGICESNFDNGKRLDYKSFYLSDSSEWILSDRTCDGNENIGTSITYNLEYDKIKNFTSTNARITDILYVDKFLENVKKTITKYYFGKTSNSLFNDDTGNAYEVIYNADGTIKTLYVGNFVDGYFNDNTGNAWDIAYAEKGGFYVYNSGEFKNGNAVNGSSTPISIDEINEIISSYDFECELKWKQN